MKTKFKVGQYVTCQGDGASVYQVLEVGAIVQHEYDTNGKKLSKPRRVQLYYLDGLGGWKSEHQLKLSRTLPIEVYEYRRVDGVSAFRYMGGWVVKSVFGVAYFWHPEKAEWVRSTTVSNTLPFRIMDTEKALEVLGSVTKYDP